MSTAQLELLPRVAALYVERGGIYFGDPDIDPWDVARDARKYAGPLPVIAHPPCQLWVNLAAVNWKRYGRDKPAWYDGGSDGGCFESALASVRFFGGVLEHPAGTWAWKKFCLLRPYGPGWQPDYYYTGGSSPHRRTAWVCEVWQSAYGHQARKRTWLYFVDNNGRRPPELDWSQPTGTHQIGWFDRVKSTLNKKAASATPPAFAETLKHLALTSRPRGSNFRP